MLPGFFGGEGGISTNRVVGSRPARHHLRPADPGVLPDRRLDASSASALMFAFTRTPLGRMLNAVRDNPERAEFIGYNTQTRALPRLRASPASSPASPAGWRRSTSRSSPPSVVGAVRSGGVLLLTFIGGVGVLLRPDHRRGAVDAALQICCRELHQAPGCSTSGLSSCCMVMYAPGGIASLIMMNLRVAAVGKLRRAAGRRMRCALACRWRCVAGGAVGAGRDGAITCSSTPRSGPRCSCSASRSTPQRRPLARRAA